MTNEEAIRRAQQAKLILDDPLFKESMAAIKETIIGQWCDLGVENKAQAEELKRLLWSAQQFESIFAVTIGGGTVAQNELLNDTTMKARQEATLRRVYG